MLQIHDYTAILGFQIKSCFIGIYKSCAAVRLAPSSSQESCTIQSTMQVHLACSLYVGTSVSTVVNGVLTHDHLCPMLN